MLPVRRFLYISFSSALILRTLVVALYALLPPHASQLVIPAGRSKSSILGFYDVAIGEKKQLRVRYRFKGKRHEAVWADKQAVALPLRDHLVEE